jgi:hypothetical protein
MEKMVRKTRNRLLKLFQANVNKTMIAVPVQSGPTPQYWGSKVERYFK